jgi:hypothetical protein
MWKDGASVVLSPRGGCGVGGVGASRSAVTGREVVARPETAKTCRTKWTAFEQTTSSERGGEERAQQGREERKGGKMSVEV